MLDSGMSETVAQNWADDLVDWRGSGDFAMTDCAA
jgi:hypothetical protein